MKNPIPADWLDGRPEGLVIHWTGGGPRPSAEDKRHYHLIIDQEGQVHRGSYLISDNDDTSDQEYAAHTRGFNTHRVGVALSGMINARERPFDPGPYPIKPLQWDVLIEVCARLAHHYDWPITEQVFTFHSRVQQVHGVQQLGKWDISVLPWDRSMTPYQIVENLIGAIRRASPAPLDPIFKMLPTVNVEDILAPIYNQGLVLSLREFQRAHGLVPDAVIGPLTWAALFDAMEKGAEAPSTDHSE